MIKKPHPLDVHIGNRLRWQRKMLGMSQKAFGQCVGLTFQQIQKYERGVNSISSRRLYEFSHVLQVALTFFYEGYGEKTSYPIPQDLSPLALALAHDFNVIPSRQCQRSIATLVREIAKGHRHG